MKLKGFTNSMRSRVFRVHAELYHTYKEGKKGEEPLPDTPMPSGEYDSMVDHAYQIFGYKRSARDIPNLVALNQMKQSGDVLRRLLKKEQSNEPFDQSQLIEEWKRYEECMGREG